MKRLSLVALASAAAIIFAKSATASQETLLRDPWVPPEVIAKRASAQGLQQPSSGAELQAQVERKLRAGFDAADVEQRGSITREQAKSAGLGLIAREFERIDAARTGRVTFEDYKRYLRARGAAL